jgi:hypothetical protein
MTSRKDHKATGKNHSGKDRFERQHDDVGTRAAAAMSVFMKEIAWAELERAKGFDGVAGLLAENASDKLIKTVKEQCPGHLLIETKTGVLKTGLEAYARYVDATTTITVERTTKKK